jgi:HEPN domain-containing protein
VTNGERADRLVGEARHIAGEMKRALDDEAWNLATRRAQEVLELAIKALLNER